MPVLFMNENKRKKRKSESLFEYADKNEIFVEYRKIPNNKSLSTSALGKNFIALDYSLLFDTVSERVHLTHELGHCTTGGFYNIYSPYDVREKYENRANKWAVHKLIPFEELQEAFSNGIIERWELAEYFEVTEDFIDTVIQIYQNEGLLAG